MDFDTLAKKLTGRIYNWMFESALLYIDGAKTDEGKAIIRQLAEEYGDIGWVLGCDADREVIKLFELEPHLVDENFG